MISRITMTPSYVPVLTWAGSNRRLAPLVLAVLAACVAAGLAGAQEPVETTADIRINLPANGLSRVEVSPGPEGVALDLPRGAEFPADFAAASSGMLSGGIVESHGERVTIDLELGHGYLERVIYEPGALVLRLRSRFQGAPVGAGEGERYQLGPDDRIRLTVHNQADLSGSLVVSRDGQITVPLIGDVPAAGLTPRELAARLTERFDRTYLVDPRVDVAVEEYRSQWVMVTGEIEKPGRVALRGGTRLKEVIGESAGLTDFSGDEITISRRIEGSDETVVVRVSRADFETGRMNPRLGHGDIIDVPRAASCYVQGEVREAGKVTIERGMTLMRAIAEVGGVTDWADRKNVSVRREDGSLTSYNLNKIESGREADPPLSGGEMIIVRKRFL